MTADIRYLKREAIDTEAWDRCINNAGEGRIYAESAWLDSLATHWDGLILRDYEAVMPLPWRSRMGIRYLYPPFLTAQLGPVGADGNADPFLAAIPSSFRYWDLPLNSACLHSAQFPVQVRTNFFLPLDAPYETLRARFRDNIRRNAAKAQKMGCRPMEEVTLDEVIPLAMSAAPDGYIHDRDIRGFKKAWQFLQAADRAKAYGIRSAGGDLLASAAFVYGQGRAYYLLVGNHPNGRTLGASHALIDGFIRLHAGRKLVLDFEGSDLRNLAFFYSSFGAYEEQYGTVHLNRLPFYLRWLKR